MLALRDRLAQVEGQARTLRDRLDKLYVSPDREAERGKAMMDGFGSLRAYGPDMKDLPGGWKAPGPHWGHEQFGPEMPPGFQMPPHPGSPVPVHMVGTSVEHMPTGPLGPELHRDFTLGNNSGGFGSPGIGASDHLDPGPRRGPNIDMLQAHPVELQTDDTALLALDAKLTEVEQHAHTLGATPIAVKADSASVEALIALLTRAISLKAQLGSGAPGGGTSGSLGTSYPQTAPAGRQGGPR